MSDSGKILVFDPLHTPLQSPAAPAEPTFEIDQNAANALSDLIRIIQECGQNPATQLAGYLITEDPIYLPEHDHARLLANRVGRDKLLEILIDLYMQDHPSEGSASPRL